jgi:spermidine synthase
VAGARLALIAQARPRAGVLQSSNVFTRSAERPIERSATAGVLLLCFFLSGATGLVYEVVWLRMLGLVFGHTVYAITTVLAAFMAGLGLGSFVFGRLAARIRRPVLTYGVLEIGVGLSCALVPMLLWLASFLYVGLHALLALSYTAFSLVQFVLAFALLLVPTTLMGGTLPILSQALVQREAEIGRMVGTLYAVNTFGAMLGVVAAGYWLLPALGNRATVAVAVVANLAVGALAVAYSRRLTRVPHDPAVAARPEAAAPGVTAPPSTMPASLPAGATVAAPVEPEPAPASAAPGARDLGVRLTVVALGVSGAVSMIYEVAWTRALALVIGSSTYAFTAMLVAFLLGIAGGAAVYALIWGTRRATPTVFATLQIGIGLAAAFVLLVFERLPELFILSLKRWGTGRFVEVVQFVVSAHAMLPTTLLIGATFPCAVAVWARHRSQAGEDVGRLYAVNTLGAIAGVVVAGFALIPALGVHASVKVGIVVNLALAATLALVPPRPVVILRWGLSVTALIAAGGLVSVPAWDPVIMSSGPAVYAQQYVKEAEQGFFDPLHGAEVLYYRDGPSSTVSVGKSGDHVSLRVNGKVDASTGGDMPTQILLGHLGPLVHPGPRKVLVIGLGSGVTAAGAAMHGVERVDVIEIEPGVVEANRFFAGVNGDVLKNPRVRVLIADARNFLVTTTERYDVIISEPSNPWISGVATLFTREFFALARQRLRPGGLMVQWVHTYSLLAEDLRMLVTTFRTAFPATSIWQPSSGDLLLLGRTGPGPIDLETLKARYESSQAIREDLARIGVRGWSGPLGYFVLGETDTARYADGGRLNTDDALPLEFSAPRALYIETGTEAGKQIGSFRSADLPEVTPASRAELEEPDVRAWIGMVLLGRGVPSAAARFLPPGFAVKVAPSAPAATGSSPSR